MRCDAKLDCGNRIRGLGELLAKLNEEKDNEN